VSPLSTFDHYYYFLFFFRSLVHIIIILWSFFVHSSPSFLSPKKRVKPIFVASPFSCFCNNIWCFTTTFIVSSSSPHNNIFFLETHKQKLIRFRSRQNYTKTIFKKKFYFIFALDIFGFIAEYEKEFWNFEDIFFRTKHTIKSINYFLSAILQNPFAFPTTIF